jgi:hypothetical protein
MCGEARTLFPGGVSVDLQGRLGSADIQFLIAFDPGNPGTYAAGTLGDSATSSLYGATLDGAGHWQNPQSGGSMTVTTNDSGGASGSVGMTLVNGSQTMAVKGAWRCVKTAGA